MSDSEEPITGFLSSTAAPSASPADIPQFSTAEYAHIPGTERCRICNSLIPQEYYRVNGQMACSICARQASEGQPLDTHAAFARGLLLGIGAAIVGLIGYAAFTIVSHIYLGYLAVGVGWFIGKAMIRGSNGLGGTKYQVVAVVLTYLSITLAEAPIILAQIYRSPNFHGSLVAVILHYWPRLLWRSLASPFYDLSEGLHGILGLIILFVGLQFAWRFTAQKPLAVDGPYSTGA